jgi:high-affinity nickel-transport protein
MAPLPGDWLALVTLVFVLGLKHGLDADHLVAIDGLARFNSLAHPRRARWCGLLFSLGHGAVVLGVALAVGLAADLWTIPGWLEDVGAWVSIAFLAGLGLLNCAALLGTSADRVVQPVGLRGRLFGRLFGRLTRTSHPGAIALVGGLFAVSFDTISQAALFAITANQFGGWEHAVVLGLAFMLGMTLVDGANGLWIAALLRSAHARALVASRLLGLTVVALSFGVAAFAVAGRWSSTLAAWAEGRELAFGLGVIVVVAAAFLLGLAVSRPALAEAPAPRRF